MTGVFGKIWIGLGLVLLPWVALSQGAGDSEEEFIAKATELFEAGSYAEAEPLYSQLLANYRDNSEYQYRYGACVLFGLKDKKKALQYMTYALEDPEVSAEAYFFMGRANQLSYRFKEAISSYEEFKSKANAKQIARLDVDYQIQTCRNGQKLLRDITDIVVLSKKEQLQKDFFRSYNMTNYGGKILPKPDEFQSKQDKKDDDQGILYLQQGGKEVYYAARSEKNETGKDIYFVIRQPDGEFSKPQRLSSKINTALDEDYPFIHPNGKRLFFASKGHNSMGGYDIFVSDFDESTGDWGKPVNMDFAINTPDDDFMLVANKEEKTAYFSSNRESPNGKVNVYEIELQRIPYNKTLIKGEFIAENTKSAEIIVNDLESRDLVGTYMTDKESGEYLLDLPTGGSFEFLVKLTEGDIPFKGIVKLPPLKRSATLKQQMEITGAEGEEQLVIKNLFDEMDEDIRLSAEMLEAKASLEVGGAKPSVTIEDEPADPRLSMSEDEIAGQARQEVETIRQQAKEFEEEAAKAYALATQKQEEAEAKRKEADAALAGLDGKSEDEQVVQKQLAAQLREEARQLSTEAQGAYLLAKELEEKGEERAKAAPEAERLLVSAEASAQVGRQAGGVESAG